MSVRELQPDEPTWHQKWYAWFQVFDHEEWLEQINRIVMSMCEASHFSHWPDEMQERPMWVIRQYLEHREKRLKEVRKDNKDQMFPIIPDWIS